jgi:hypothetical protein
MSEESTELFNATLPGEAWWISALFVAALRSARPGASAPIMWQGIDVREMWIEPEPPGVISFTASGESTAVRIVAPLWAGPFWLDLAEAMTTAAKHAQNQRRRASLTAERVIERYYRIKAAGGKTTLRQLAEEYGYHPNYLSQVKRQHDAAGKWGSKVKGRNLHKNTADT